MGGLLGGGGGVKGYVGPPSQIIGGGLAPLPPPPPLPTPMRFKNKKKMKSQRVSSRAQTHSKMKHGPYFEVRATQASSVTLTFLVMKTSGNDTVVS